MDWEVMLALPAGREGLMVSESRGKVGKLLAASQNGGRAWRAQGPKVVLHIRRSDGEEKGITERRWIHMHFTRRTLSIRSVAIHNA
jgi:hypothetical protein